MTLLRQFFYSVIISLTAWVNVSFAEPLLNGLSLHQELGQDIFVGALYSESLSNNADTLLNSTQPMRLELKIVVAEGMSARQFSRLWIEGMAVNQRADVLTAQAENVVFFDKLFNGRLAQNDHIVIRNTPNQGVSVEVNTHQLGVIKDAKFFNILLSTWIGRVPLSSGFRDGLLKMGDVDGSLRARFDSLQPSAARKQIIASWLQSASSSVAAISSSSKAAISSSSRAQASSAPVIAAPIPAPMPLPIEAPKLELPVIAASSSSAAVEAVEPEEDEGPALTTQSLLARQFYISDVLQKVNEKVRYPSRAFERNQEGFIRVQVVLDRAGNVLSTSFIEESRYPLLNREANDAISRAAPFPPAPDAILGNRIEVSIPLRFVIPR